MEIARLEVSTQQHLDRMQETAKVKYVQYEKSTKSKKGKKSTQSGASGSSHRGDRGHGTSSKPSGKGRKLPFPQDTCYRCGKGRHQKIQDCKAVDMVCRGCGKKGHFEKVCLKKCSTHSLEVRGDCPEIREFSAELGHARNPGHSTRNMRGILSDWYLFSSLQDIQYHNVLCASHCVVYGGTPLMGQALGKVLLTSRKDEPTIYGGFRISSLLRFQSY